MQGVCDRRGNRASRMLLHQKFRQPYDFFLPLAQRRHPDRDYVETVIQVLAEAPVGNGFLEIAVSRGNDPHINTDRLFSAQPLEFLILKHLQKFSLQLEIHVADFIQQNRAAIGHFKHAGLLLKSSGKRAALVSEQLALHQLRRQSRAVELEKNLVRPWRLRAELTSDDFFADPGLALYEYRDLGTADLSQQRFHGFHTDAARERMIAFQMAVLLAQYVRYVSVESPVSKRFLNGTLQVIMAHRLRNEIGGAALHGLHHLERRGSARQHHDGQVFIPATDFPQRFQTVLPRHHHVEQH